MKHSIRMLAVMLCAVFLVGSLSACGDTTPAESAGTGTQELTGSETAVPETAGATVITFSGTSAAAEGAGAEITGGTVTVTAGGTYVVTGTAAEGRVIVNAPGEEVVLVLQNADITCSDGSPLYGYKAARLTVYLAEGSENTLTDGGSYSFSDSYSSAAEEEPNACLYAKSDLVIAGSGALTVRGNYNNGITGKDTLTIEAADLTVTAQNHGITGKDSCTVQNAALRVECGGDALRATNTDDSTLGNIVITDSVLDLTAGEDGIQAETALTVIGGSCTVQSGGGSAVITGGTVVAAGSSGMAQNFGADSTQGSILLSYPSAASDQITLQDAAGRTLVSYTSGKSYNCVVISCPAITQGSTYTVTACGQTDSVTMSSLIYGSGGMGGGPGGRGDMNVPGGKGGMGGPAGRP